MKMLSTNDRQRLAQRKDKIHMLLTQIFTIHSMPFPCHVMAFPMIPRRCFALLLRVDFMWYDPVWSPFVYLLCNPRLEVIGRAVWYCLNAGLLDTIDK